ncbi:MAG: polysaccharide deacetylase family protein [Bryobacterales bacterium]|nr:polysaccharide deacetylase family protein [Bryobacterales bacterium]MBV9396387.1 polysaccharide deacetylase family protein [Bryobacterales bacterium]
MKSWILTYHSLDVSGSVISVDPAVFRQHMSWLAQTGTQVVPLERIFESPGAVALTFDDGFRNFYELAFPVLQQYRFPATVFVVTGYCAGKNDWPSQPALPHVPTLPLMNWSELQNLAAAGIDLGSHTINHSRMATLSDADTERELRASQEAIEDRTGKPVMSFAYPYGESTPQIREAVRKRFRVACGTKLAYVSPESDPAELPRLDTFYLQEKLWFEALGKQYGAAYIAARSALRELRSSWNKRH